jgi:hypothetical protein
VSEADGDRGALGRAAANVADWHATSVEALGGTSTRWPGAWAAKGLIPPIYLDAIVFSVGLSAADQVGRLAAFFADRPPTRALVILDGTNQLDLSQLGFDPETLKPCFWRTPDQTTAPAMPDDLEIVEVNSRKLLAEFEAASMEGFDAPNVPRFAWHAPGVLTNPRFRLWLGRSDGRAVGAAMAYAGDELIGIYGVTIVPGARRRGYAAALTWQALQVDPRLPAALQPSEMAIGMYQRLGFAPIGNFSVWHRPAHA